LGTPFSRQQETFPSSPHGYRERIERQENWRANSLMRFILFGAVGFGIGVAIAFGTLLIPVGGAMGGVAGSKSERQKKSGHSGAAGCYRANRRGLPDAHPSCHFDVCIGTDGGDSGSGGQCITRCSLLGMENDRGPSRGRRRGFRTRGHHRLFPDAQRRRSQLSCPYRIHRRWGRYRRSITRSGPPIPRKP
jgi:hypothetical protein